MAGPENHKPQVNSNKVEVSLGSKSLVGAEKEIVAQAEQVLQDKLTEIATKIQKDIDRIKSEYEEAKRRIKEAEGTVTPEVLASSRESAIHAFQYKVDEVKRGIHWLQYTSRQPGQKN